MSLKTKIQALIEKAKICNMTMKWLTIGAETEDAYDFVNVFGVDLYYTMFVFTLYEKTITDEYTTTVAKALTANSSDLLERVIMPNVREVQKRGFYYDSVMTYCELGQITRTVTSSFQGCKALETFKCKEGTTGDIYLQYSPNLNVESLDGIAKSYADMTGQSSPVFHCGGKNIDKMSDETKLIFQNKNITLM